MRIMTVDPDDSARLERIVAHLEDGGLLGHLEKRFAGGAR